MIQLKKLIKKSNLQILNYYEDKKSNIKFNKLFVVHESSQFISRGKYVIYFGHHIFPSNKKNIYNYIMFSYYKKGSGPLSKKNKIKINVIEPPRLENSSINEIESVLTLI